MLHCQINYPNKISAFAGMTEKRIWGLLAGPADFLLKAMSHELISLFFCSLLSAMLYALL
jgi:hypothetical protein